jgi:hypothetical protein
MLQVVPVRIASGASRNIGLLLGPDDNGDRHGSHNTIISAAASTLSQSGSIYPFEQGLYQRVEISNGCCDTV